MKRLLGTIAALALALTALVGVQPASAATSCEFAKQRALASALSLGDISLASKASRMCDAPCDSIYAYYVLPNLSSYVESLVLDAYKTCVAANSGGGGNGGGGSEPKPCTPKAFTKVGIPSITGTLKPGYTLNVKTTSWSPTPSRLVYDWYRDGKKVISDTTQIYLDSSDIGKKLTLRVTASLECYKTKTVTSVATKTITKNNLPKLKASQVKLLMEQDYFDSPEGGATSILRLTSKYGDFWFDVEPVWTWVGDRGPWASENKGYSYAFLPTSRFLDDYGDTQQMCVNGKKYNISVTMTAGIMGKYDAAKITFPAKQYICRSDSDNYRAE